MSYIAPDISGRPKTAWSNGEPKTQPNQQTKSSSGTSGEADVRYAQSLLETDDDQDLDYLLVKTSQDIARAMKGKVKNVSEQATREKFEETILKDLTTEIGDTHATEAYVWNSVFLMWGFVTYPIAILCTLRPRKKCYGWVRRFKVLWTLVPVVLQVRSAVYAATWDEMNSNKREDGAVPFYSLRRFLACFVFWIALTATFVGACSLLFYGCAKLGDGYGIDFRGANNTIPIGTIGGECPPGECCTTMTGIERFVAPVFAFVFSIMLSLYVYSLSNPDDLEMWRLNIIERERTKQKKLKSVPLNPKPFETIESMHYELVHNRDEESLKQLESFPKRCMNAQDMILWIVKLCSARKTNRRDKFLNSVLPVLFPVFLAFYPAFSRSVLYKGNAFPTATNAEDKLLSTFWLLSATGTMIIGTLFTKMLFMVYNTMDRRAEHWSVVQALGDKKRLEGVNKDLYKRFKKWKNENEEQKNKLDVEEAQGRHQTAQQQESSKKEMLAALDFSHVDSIILWDHVRKFVALYKENHARRCGWIILSLCIYIVTLVTTTIVFKVLGRVGTWAEITLGAYSVLCITMYVIAVFGLYLFFPTLYCAAEINSNLDGIKSKVQREIWELKCKLVQSKVDRKRRLQEESQSFQNDHENEWEECFELLEGLAKQMDMENFSFTILGLKVDNKFIGLVGGFVVSGASFVLDSVLG